MKRKTKLMIIFGMVSLLLIFCLTGCMLVEDSDSGTTNSGGSSGTSSSYSITLPNVPATYSYTYDGDYVYSEVKVTKVSYKVEYGYLTLIISGEKTYDEDGDEQSDMCMIGYKIYDSENYVVDSGVIFTNDLCVGEKFRDYEHTTLLKIERGKQYRVVFEDYNI